MSDKPQFGSVHSFPLDRIIRKPYDGDEPPGGDDVEARLSRVEDAIFAIRSSQDRMEQRFDAFQSDMTAVKVSQGRIEERMERVMDKAREMPTEAKINSLLNHKLTLLGIIIAAVLALAQWLPGAV